MAKRIWASWSGKQTFSFYAFALWNSDWEIQQHFILGGVMDKTLLLGNGLNRTLKDGFSWADMLKDLGSDGDGGDSVPFPI